MMSKKTSKSLKHMRCLFLQAGHGKLIANPWYHESTVQDKITNYS